MSIETIYQNVLSDQLDTDTRTSFNESLAKVEDKNQQGFFIQFALLSRRLSKDKIILSNDLEEPLMISRFRLVDLGRIIFLIRAEKVYGNAFPALLKQLLICNLSQRSQRPLEPDNMHNLRT